MQCKFHMLGHSRKCNSLKSIMSARNLQHISYKGITSSVYTYLHESVCYIQGNSKILGCKNSNNLRQWSFNLEQYHWNIRYGLSMKGGIENWEEQEGPDSETWFAVWSWASYLISLCLSFFTCNMRIVLVLALLSYWKDYMRWYTQILTAASTQRRDSKNSLCHYVS